jgi:hypothetical protein
MKWKIRPARDMAQEAFVVIDAPTSEEAEAILWHDMDPDVLRWSDDEVMGDREVTEVYPADDNAELTPLGMPPVRQPKALKTYRVTWVIKVGALEIAEAGTRFIPFIDPVRSAWRSCLGSVSASLSDAADRRRADL